MDSSCITNPDVTFAARILTFHHIQPHKRDCARPPHCAKAVCIRESTPKPSLNAAVTSLTNRKSEATKQHLSLNPLLLGRIGLSSSILRPLRTLAGVSVLGPRIPQLSVRTTLNSRWHVALADLLDLVLYVDDREGELELAGVVGGGRGDILLAGVLLLVLTDLAWEQDQASAEGLKTGDVGGKGFGGEVLAAGIDGDTDGWCKLAWDTSLLQKATLSDKTSISAWNAMLIPSTQ